MKKGKEERQKRKRKKEQSATLKSCSISFCLRQRDFNHEGEKKRKRRKKEEKRAEIREKLDWISGFLFFLFFFLRVSVCWFEISQTILMLVIPGQKQPPC